MIIKVIKGNCGFSRQVLFRRIYGHVPLSIAIVILVLLSGFFSGTETAYSCANKIKLKSMVALGKKNAKAVYAFARGKITTNSSRPF